MQTRRQSRYEIGVDFVLSLLVNLVAQMLFYGVLATTARSLTFAALILLLAVPRRYTLRRFFNSFVNPGARQPRWQSWFEVGVDTVVAIVVAILLQRLVYGDAATLTKAGSVTVLLYAVTMGRRYALRRVCETWNTRGVETAAA